jgi:hypothetical protein
MEAPSENSVVLEFSEIHTLVDRLTSQLITYIKKKFYQYDYVKAITIDNIISTVEKLREEEDAKKALDPNPGAMQAIGSVVHGYTVGLIISETPYHRLEQLRYFAAKAVLFRDTTREMLRLSQLGTFDWNENNQQKFWNLSRLLIDELKEFIKTSETLFTTAQNQDLTIQSKEFSGTLKGMNGGSGLAKSINTLIIIDFKAILEKIVSEINSKVDATIARKLSDAQKAYQYLQTLESKNSAASTPSVPVNEPVNSYVNQFNGKGLTPLHEAILSYDLERTKQCLEAGADPNLCTRVRRLFPDHKEKTPHRSPLCLAILDDSGRFRNPVNFFVVQALVEKKADVNFLSPPNSRSFIHICIFTTTNKGVVKLRDKFNLPLIKLLTDNHCDLTAYRWEDFKSLLSPNPNRSKQLTTVIEYLQNALENSKGSEQYRGSLRLDSV